MPAIAEENERNLSVLAELLKKNAVIPYVGAGFSKGPYPLWSEYLLSIPPEQDQGAKDRIGAYLKNGHYENAGQYLSRVYGRRFITVTSEVFGHAHIRESEIGDAVSLLPQLFEGPIITTNLDQLIEHVYQSNGVGLKVALAGQTQMIQRLAADNKSCLWKIHGDVDDPASWVLTTDGYKAQYEAVKQNWEPNSFLSCFTGILQNRVLLFLGCSLESDKIVTVLKQLYQLFPNSNHFAILPKAGDNAVFVRACRRLGQLGITPIWYPEGEYAQVGALLRQLLSVVGRRYQHIRFTPSVPPPKEVYIKKKRTSLNVT